MLCNNLGMEQETIEQTVEQSGSLPDNDFAFEELLDDEHVLPADAGEAADEPADEPGEPEGAEPREPAEPEGEPKEATDEWDELVNQAEQWGMTKEEAKSFENPAHLQRAITHLARVASAFREQPKGETKQTEKVETSKYVPKLSPELYDPEIIKEFEDINAHYSTQLDEMRKMLDGVSEHYQQQRVREEVEWLDSQFDAFEPELQELVGKGQTNSLSPNGKELRKRQELYRTAVELAKVDPSASRDTIFKRAKAAVFHDQLLNIATKRQSQEAAKRARDTKGKFTTPPTTRDGKPLTSDERAQKFVRDFIKDKAGDDGSDVDFAFEGSL